MSAVQDVYLNIPFFDLEGRALFFNNSCEGSGGGMAIIGGMGGDFLKKTALFSDYTAGVSGGAIFVTGAGKGLEFSGIRFRSNLARIGGGVYVTGSGTTVDKNNTHQQYPTTFSQCSFERNVASATGES